MLVFDGVQSLDVFGPLDVFAEANGFVAAADRYEIVSVGPKDTLVRASNGLRIAADTTYEAADGPFDILLIPGGPKLPNATAFDPELLHCIEDLISKTEVYGSICTGAFLLGEAGLLDGRRVTTHWQSARELAARFPKASVDFDRIFVRDGPLITSAGVTAGIDLALSIVREHHGREIALSVAKRLVVVAQRQGGQSQFSPYVDMVPDESSHISRAIAYVLENLDERLSVADLAAVSAMSSRNFARVFRASTGDTPAEFVEKARIDRARALLEGSGKPLKVIAHECGFGSSKRMREVFVKRLGVLPLHYRERFTLPAD